MKIRYLFVLLASLTGVALAGFLRQSSDDLTRLVRTYGATGDAQYKDQYNAVLDLRNGKAPQPVDYYRIYWDFVAGGNPEPRPFGKAVALRDEMKQAGFTDQEFALPDEANNRSDGLVKLEVQAMELIDTRDPANRLKAIDLVNSSDYHYSKANIMKHIDDFYVMLAKRLEGNIAQANARADFYWTAMLVRDTGEVLKTIEDYIVTINRHMEAIATSAREQSAGLSEVNTAVNQMDQVTQKNAAMVEETNAASAALALEGDKLYELISRFQLAEQAGSANHVNDLRQMGRAMSYAPGKAQGTI